MSGWRFVESKHKYCFQTYKPKKMYYLKYIWSKIYYIYLLRTDNGHCRPQSQSDAVAIAAVTVMLSIIYLLRTDTGDTVVCKNSVTIFIWQI